MPRRLAAIVAADISGYSRLMEIDEEGTHNRVKRIERDLIEPSIAEHHGRLVKTTGDGFIAIFDSPVEAVRCGIVIQQNMIGRNAALPKHHWIEYRIGVNLGDVIIEANDVYGDGVNVASRLEGIAEPGQVYISGGIYEQIKHKLVCGYESLGDRKVKNITDPVRVYRVLPDPAALQQEPESGARIILIFLLSLILLVIASGASGICFRSRMEKRWRSGVNPGSAKDAEWAVIAGTACETTAPLPQPSTPAAPATQEAAPQIQAAPSAAASRKAATRNLSSPVQPRLQDSRPPAVREPEMNSLRGGSFTWEAMTISQRSQLIKSRSSRSRSASIRFPFANGTNAPLRRDVHSWRPAKMTRP